MVHAIPIAQSNLNFQNFEPERKTVMICEDDPDILKLYGLALKPRYNVMLVGSGEDCIERFMGVKNYGTKIDLILLDYKMGGISCESVAKKIKESDGTKIILISGYNIEESILKELEENKYIVKYVKKPIYLSGLIEIVKETIHD
jgi:CheY-like chemotaxis protein